MPQLLATNFLFNDVHRRVIYLVQHAYYRLLNASGQEVAARASLADTVDVIVQRTDAYPDDRLATYLDAQPETERVVKEILSLPIHGEMPLNDVDRVCDVIAEFYGKK